MDIKKLFRNASRDTVAANTGLQGSIPECHKAAALGGTVQRKTESTGRIVVSFIGFRVRPLDPDNFAGGCKDLLDGLRKSDLLPDDSPTVIDFHTAQQKVAHRSEEKTVIELEY